MSLKTGSNGSVSDGTCREGSSAYIHFYLGQASREVALKIDDWISQRIESLNNLAQRGKIEFYLSELKQGHRYVIEGNFKVIYLVGVDRAIVTDVFDMLQDPEEIIKRAK